MQNVYTYQLIGPAEFRAFSLFKNLYTELVSSIKYERTVRVYCA